MHEPLMLRRLAIIPTLKCTLKCKLCSNYVTMFNNPKHVPVHEIISDIDRIFEIVDYTEWLQFVGGEIFMRNDLWEVYEHCLRYKEKFDKLIIITNATLLPCKKDIVLYKKYGENLQIQISNYAKYSYKKDDLVELFIKENIPYVIKKYHGDIQHYGGWVDNTDFSDRGRSDAELQKQFESCGQYGMKNFHLYRGKFHGCARSLMASELGKIKPAKRDFIDLNDDETTIAEKRETIRNFNNTPRVSCRSCVSFGDDTIRFKAAEQI
ncbi:MAG: radical SAM protein [Oscillospiraceae bacterium]|nr:radical SAM protein [Oscillospiraceae bacterium]